MRVATRLIPILALCGSLPAATLEKLSLDEMILKSTEIVRGRVVSSQTVAKGSIIYTQVSIQVSERWKGPAAASVTVWLHGGTLGGLRQHYPGTPELRQGYDYLLFLWTGSSGMTYIIGLSQGLFELEAQLDAKTASLRREASTEVMLDPRTGRVVADEPLELSLGEMSGRIRRVLGAGR